MKHIAACVGAIVFGSLLPLPAAAQFRCMATNGVIYQSASPCRAVRGPEAETPSGRSGGVRYFPPAEPESRYQQRPPSIGEAPSHLKYMSPQCAGLHDALRTASARGLNPDTVTKMRKDYSDRCSEDEGEARMRFNQELRERSNEKRELQVGEARARDRTSLQKEQCGESKRILVTKRARTDLTEGEKSELKRFEENFRTRCG